MSAIVVEVLFIFFLTVLNGVFAMSETAIVASRKARLQQWANEGNTKAQAAVCCLCGSAHSREKEFPGVHVRTLTIRSNGEDSFQRASHRPSTGHDFP